MLASLLGGGFVARLLPYGIAFLVGAVLVTGIYRAGYNSARRLHEIDRKETMLAKLQHDAAINESALVEERRQLAELQAAKAKDAERTNELAKELELQKALCVVTPDVLERLRREGTGSRRK